MRSRVAAKGVNAQPLSEVRLSVSLACSRRQVLTVTEYADDAVIVDADASDLRKAPPAGRVRAFLGVVTVSSAW
jgi:hypothetical protein